MSQFTISTDLVRRVRQQPPSAIDRLPRRQDSWICFARAADGHSLVARAIAGFDAGSRSGAWTRSRSAMREQPHKQRRAQAALGQSFRIASRPRSLTLRAFLADILRALDEGHVRQAHRASDVIRAAFRELLDLKLSEFTSARVDRWRATLPQSSLIRRVERGGALRSLDRRSTATSRRYARHWRGRSSGARLSARAVGENQNGNRRMKTRSCGTCPRTKTRGSGAALVARDNIRRAARESANVWRRERGVRGVVAVRGRTTDHLTPLVLLAVNTGLRRGRTSATAVA
jgi:hypothetical protein